MRLLTEMGEAVCFPVLRFAEHSIQRFRSEAELNIGTSKSLIRPHGKTRPLIIDSQCHEFPVLEVRYERRTWNPAYWFAPAPVFVLTTRLGKSSQVDFEEIRRRLVDQVVRMRWYTQGDENEEEFRSAFEKIKSIDELIENVSLYGRRTF